MDNSLTIKPRPGVAPRSNALRDPVTVREAVDTDLDPSKTVTAAADSGSKHSNNNGPHHEASARDVIIDPRAQAALFSAVDVRAEHPGQSPNRALMRQRAYQQHQAPKDLPAEGAPVSDPHADIEA